VAIVFNKKKSTFADPNFGKDNWSVRPSSTEALAKVFSGLKMDE
jgi:hypothetical protein